VRARFAACVLDFLLTGGNVAGREKASGSAKTRRLLQKWFVEHTSSGSFNEPLLV
jgi:hypothetical protein